MFKTSRGLGTNIFSLRHKRPVSTELKNWAFHLKEQPKISKFTKFDGYWFKPKGMAHLIWIGGTGVLQSILSSLNLKVYHAFAFKQIIIKLCKFTNFWMYFQMMCLIFNSINTEYSHQAKICSYPVPCSFLTWPIGSSTFFYQNAQTDWVRRHLILIDSTSISDTGQLDNPHLEVFRQFVSSIALRPPSDCFKISGLLWRDFIRPYTICMDSFVMAMSQRVKC